AAGFRLGEDHARAGWDREQESAVVAGGTGDAHPVTDVAGRLVEMRIVRQRAVADARPADRLVSVLLDDPAPDKDPANHLQVKGDRPKPLDVADAVRGGQVRRLLAGEDSHLAAGSLGQADRAVTALGVGL